MSVLIHDFKLIHLNQNMLHLLMQLSTKIEKHIWKNIFREFQKLKAMSEPLIVLECENSKIENQKAVR